MKPVALIAHDVWETFGVVPKALGGAGVDLLLHEARKEESLPRIEDVSAVVIFGGEMNVDETERFPFLLAERELVRDCVRHGVPYLGICLGAQMLARASDVPVIKAAVKEIGFAALRPTAEASADPLVSTFSDGDMVFHWHEDTFDLPEGAVLLATGDHVRVQAFRVGERAWGLQFHFEVDRDELAMWLRDAGDGLKEAWGKSADEIRGEAERYLAIQESRARELFRRLAEIVKVG